MLTVLISLWLLQGTQLSQAQTIVGGEPQVCDEAPEGPAFIALSNCKTPLAPFPIFRVEKDTFKAKPISMRACTPVWSATCELLLQPPAWGRGRADKSFLMPTSTLVLTSMPFEGNHDLAATLDGVFAAIARSMRFLEFVWRAGGEDPTAPLLTLATETADTSIGSCADIKVGILHVGTRTVDVRSTCAPAVTAAHGEVQRVIASLDQGEPFVWTTNVEALRTIGLDSSNAEIRFDLFPSTTAEFEVPKIIRRRQYLAPAIDGNPAAPGDWRALVVVRVPVRVTPAQSSQAPPRGQVEPKDGVAWAKLLWIGLASLAAAWFFFPKQRKRLGLLVTRRTVSPAAAVVPPPLPREPTKPANATDVGQKTGPIWPEIGSQIRDAVRVEFDYLVPRAMQEVVADIEQRFAGRFAKVSPGDLNREVSLTVDRLLPDVIRRTAERLETQIVEAADRRQDQLVAKIVAHRQFEDTIVRHVNEAKQTWIVDAARMLVDNIDPRPLGVNAPPVKGLSQRRLTVASEAQQMLRPVEALVSLAGTIMLEWSRQGGGRRLASLTAPTQADASAAGWNTLRESHHRAYLHGLQDVLITDAPLLKAIGAQMRNEPTVSSALLDIAMQRWNISLDSAAGAARFATDWADARLPFLQTVIEALPIELRLFDREVAGLDSALAAVVRAIPDITNFGSDTETASEAASLYFHRLVEALYSAVGWRYYPVRLHRDHLDSPNVDLALRHVGNVHPIDISHLLTESGLVARHGVVVRVRQPVVQRYESTTGSDRWTGTLEFCAVNLQ